MNLYKGFSLSAMVIFIVVGFIFLFFPDSALVFFNYLSKDMGLTQSPTQGASFYLALAAAYMYVVTVLAFKMYRNSDQKIYALLLVHAKTASSIVSIYLFVAHQHYLIYLANFIVDGFIALATVYFIKTKKW